MNRHTSLVNSYDELNTAKPKMSPLTSRLSSITIVTQLELSTCILIRMCLLSMHSVGSFIAEVLLLMINTLVLQTVSSRALQFVHSRSNFVYFKLPEENLILHE